MTTFKEIFDEYYTLFRGQANKLPVYGDREFATAVQLARAGIRRWERADGVLWIDLMPMLSDGETNTTIITGVITDAPTDMRKPPAFVTFELPAGGTKDIKTTRAQDYMGQTSCLWFTGGANSGYKMHISSNLLADLNGASFDYKYYKKATLPITTADPSAMVVEMSDPSFLVQDMLASRYLNARNVFGYKASRKDADTALANMKIEDGSGVYGNNEEMFADGGWGDSGDSSGIEL